MKKKTIVLAGLIAVVSLGVVIGVRGISTYHSLGMLDEIGVIDSKTEVETSESVEENSSEIADESKSSMSGLKDVVGVEVSTSETVVEETKPETDDKVRPGIGWSSGVLSVDELEILQKAAAKVYEQNLQENGQDVTVEVAEFTIEDLSGFEYPVYYFVDDQYVLTLQMVLNVKDNTGEIKRESRALRVKYNLDVLVLAD